MGVGKLPEGYDPELLNAALEKLEKIDRIGDSPLYEHMKNDIKVVINILRENGSEISGGITPEDLRRFGGVGRHKASMIIEKLASLGLLYERNGKWYLNLDPIMSQEEAKSEEEEARLKMMMFYNRIKENIARVRNLEGDPEQRREYERLAREAENALETIVREEGAGIEAALTRLDRVLENIIDKAARVHPSFLKRTYIKMEGPHVLNINYFPVHSRGARNITVHVKSGKIWISNM